MNDADTPTSMACANCGKGEENCGDLKACVACKLVKYCNRECQIAHRSQHKKQCRKRAAELHDGALFKEHPPREECPICLLPLPLHAAQISFKTCCGKLLCVGCIYAMREEALGRGKNDLCAFCREPNPSSDAERAKRMKKLMDADNSHAFNQLAGCYATGDMGITQDIAKANELYLRAGQLGNAEAYYNLGNSYRNGRGVEMDKKKAKHFYELAAVAGDVYARHNLAILEGRAGNVHRSFNHFLLCARAGDKDSFDWVKEAFTKGVVTKDEYANTLRAYQQQHDEMKSDQRDKAEAIIAAERNGT